MGCFDGKRPIVGARTAGVIDGTTNGAVIGATDGEERVVGAEEEDAAGGRIPTQLNAA